MSNQRRPVVRVVFWVGAGVALAVGVALGVLGHLLLASAVLIGSAFLLYPLSWFISPQPSGPPGPARAWKTGTAMLALGAPITVAGVVLLLVGPGALSPGTLSFVLLIAGPGMALAGLFTRYTIRMDHPEAPDFIGAESTQA